MRLDLRKLFHIQRVIQINHRLNRTRRPRPRPTSFEPSLKRTQKTATRGVSSARKTFSTKFGNHSKKTRTNKTEGVRSTTPDHGPPKPVSRHHDTLDAPNGRPDRPKLSHGRQARDPPIEKLAEGVGQNHRENWEKEKQHDPIKLMVDIQ